jgi:hypothetical protein
MANIVITSTTNSIKLVYNTYTSNPLIPDKDCWHKSTAHFSLSNGSAYVRASEDNGMDIDLSWDGATGTMQVDSIDGVAPTSNSDLYDKLIALVA